MDTTKTCKAVLFDFDGVIVDTEGQYSLFWDRIGQEYLGDPDFGRRIKGQTLAYIYEKFFTDPAEQQRLTEALYQYESRMTYDYVPGVLDFLADLRRHDVRTAVVTSSNARKMAAVYRHRPEIPALFDRILTAEHFQRSKPDPDCYLLGMRLLDATPAETCVFEDSFNGLEAGMASGAFVIGLATTNPRGDIASSSHCVIDDFRGFAYEDMCNMRQIGTYKLTRGRVNEATRPVSKQTCK